MKEFICSYIPFSKAVLKENYLAYKTRFIFWSGSNLVLCLAQVSLWIALFRSSSKVVINGYTLDTMLSYIMLSKIIECVSFTSLEKKVSHDVSTGYIVTTLIKPINYHTELLFRSFGYVLGSCLFFLPMYCILFIILSIGKLTSFHIDTIHILFFFFSLLISFFINFYFNILFSCLVFKTLKSNGVYELKKTLIAFFSGAILPLEFFPEWLSKSLSVLPFGHLRYNAICIIQMRWNITECVFSLFQGVVWIIFLYILTRIVWKKGLSNMVIYGG